MEDGEREREREKKKGKKTRAEKKTRYTAERTVSRDRESDRLL